MRAVETREFFSNWIIYVITYVAYIITYYYICRIIVDTNVDTWQLKIVIYKTYLKARVIINASIMIV